MKMAKIRKIPYGLDLLLIKTYENFCEHFINLFRIEFVILYHAIVHRTLKESYHSIFSLLISCPLNVVLP